MMNQLEATNRTLHDAEVAYAVLCPPVRTRLGGMPLASHVLDRAAAESAHRELKMAQTAVLEARRATTALSG